MQVIILQVDVRHLQYGSIFYETKMFMNVLTTAHY
jgi:hypothetical protein